MTKGKYGIYLSFYAVLGLVLAFLGQTLLSALLFGFVLVAEKDQWAVRQTMQAFFVSLFVSIVNEVLSIINIFADIPILGAVISGIFGFIQGIISLIVLVFIIIALTRVVKGKDAGIPLLSKLANKAYGIVEHKVYTQDAAAHVNYHSELNNDSNKNDNQ